MADDHSQVTEIPDVDVTKGLSTEQAETLRKKYGDNCLEEEHTNLFLKFFSYFWGPIPWMIEIAAVLSAAVRHWEDFAIIVAMLAINAGVGFFEEFKADNAITALKQSLALQARVLREGRWQTVAANILVPGDIVLLKQGKIVPADIKLLSGEYLSVDQSALTGESLPVDKQVEEQVFSGSVVHQGEMQGQVTATGMHTYFGKTAQLVKTARPRSHFQQAVMKIGNFLILVTAGLVALILLVALFRGHPLVDTLLFALILTIAAIPVALPAVLSVTMAVGAAKLAKMKAILSRLVAIEEMAGMDILCSDKTGTLTKNELTVGEPIPFDGVAASELIIASALTCDRTAPDTIDTAILARIESIDELNAYQVTHLTAFDPVHKRAIADVSCDGRSLRVAKGAPQKILELTGDDGVVRKKIDAVSNELAAKGYRTLGVAKTDDSGKWRYLGLLPLFDPPRDDSAETIASAEAMGLDVKMVTGDHAAIGREISKKLGLGERIISAPDVFGEGDQVPEPALIEAADGFAEVFPEHKFAIVQSLQSADHIVGMTGDGVNDAPALKQADIGIAVSGATDAARAAADMVLTAPGLSVITSAVEESRRIFARMTGYATFRIAETIRVLLFLTLSILVFDFYPVTPVMIVLLAILNDFPIMMIAYDNVPVAQRPVRWNMYKVLTLAVVLGISGVIATFLLFWIAERYLELPEPVIQTIIFLKLLVAGHLTIYLTRNDGWFWTRPWPHWRLFVTTEATQILGTLFAVYGWFVEPIGWRYALLVWAYSLAEFVFNNLVQIWINRLLHEEDWRKHLLRRGGMGAHLFFRHD